MQNRKKSYFTKAELLAFAAYIVSDEWRLEKQRECRAKLEAGTINPMPWSLAERVVTNEDFKNWKAKQTL